MPCTILITRSGLKTPTDAKKTGIGYATQIVHWYSIMKAIDHFGFNPYHALEFRNDGLIQIWVSDVV